MFEILPSPSLDTVLIAARALLLIGAFWVFALAFTRWRRADERNTQRLHEQLERTFAEVRSLHETVAVMSARLDMLTERANADARLAPAGASGAQRGYDLATRLAKNGSNIDDLVSSCGLTRHEAELLARLHGGQSREASATAQWQKRAPAASRPVWPPAAASSVVPPPNQSQTPAPRPAARKRGSLVSVVG